MCYVQLRKRLFYWVRGWNFKHKLIYYCIVIIDMEEISELIKNFRNKVNATLVSDARKQEISGLCRELSEEYPVNGNFDFDRAFVDYNVHYVEDEEFMGHSAFGPVDDQYYIFVHPYGTTRFREYIKMHELGHIVLDHDDKLDTEYKEHEAEFFTRRIVGNYPLLWMTLQSIGVVLHLMIKHHDNFEEHLRDKDAYNLKVIGKYVDLSKIPPPSEP